MRIILDDDIEQILLSRTASGSDELFIRLYHAVSTSPDDVEFDTLADAISEMFKSTQIVHCQYYDNERIIELVAKAIAGEIKPQPSA